MDAEAEYLRARSDAEPNECEKLSDERRADFEEHDEQEWPLFRHGVDT
jgi:hypothetical protein